VVPTTTLGLIEPDNFQFRVAWNLSPATNHDTISLESTKTSGALDKMVSWGGLHFIRRFSFSEILSTFHGPGRSDGVEPGATTVAIFDLQGTLWGERS
jgi:hypothetical protein